MQDDRPQAQDQPSQQPQPSEPPNRPEPASEVRVSASESASQPVAPAEAETQPQPSEAVPSPEPPPTPQDTTSQAVSTSTSPQSEPSGNTPSAQGMPPESEREKPENQTVQAATEPQSKPEPEAVQPQNQEPTPAPSVLSPPAIPSLHYPFYGSYPATFDFGAQPTDEKIKQKYQEWGIVGHNGLDFGLQEGTEVLACDEGVVTQAGDNGDFGISITIRHSWGISLYAHLQSIGVLLNDHVTKARVIGSSGQTGFTTGPHLHFGIQPNNPDSNNGYLGYIDPKPYLSETSEKPQPQEKPSDLSGDLSVSPPVSPQSPLPSEVSTKEGQSPQTPEPVGEPQTPPPPVADPDPAEVERLAQEKMKANWQQYQPKGNPAKQARKEESLQKIFAFAQEKKEITNEQVRDLLHISQSTATDYLSKLVNRGMLKTEGKGKATVYTY